MIAWDPLGARPARTASVGSSTAEITAAVTAAVRVHRRYAFSRI